MAKKLITLHRKWMKDGEMPHCGLCNSVPHKYWETLRLFHPNKREDNRRKEESYSFWGAGVSVREAHATTIRQGYTARRQSIVLLICAMHGEL